MTNTVRPQQAPPFCAAMLAAWLAGPSCTPAEAPTGAQHHPPAATSSTAHQAAHQPKGSEPSPAPAPSHDAGRCGALGCRLFATAQQALQVVLESNPKVLAVGEAHAHKGTEQIESTARRFTDTFLPLLALRATALVVELPIADGHCGKVEQATRDVAQKVTREQAASNPNEYVSLAQQARTLGIVPYPLRLSCAQYRRIAEAGPQDIAAALAVIAQTMQTVVMKRLADNPTGLVLTYGGALHNDLQPDAGHAAWSFGPALKQSTSNATVELDLIVREYIRDNEVWQALAWTAVFDPGEHTESFVLYEPTPKSFVLIFPSSKPAVPQ
ncbi:MAG: hypothetical protein JW940_16930 [Polyangiaceae bacterium]|nr:hypothetical protein [Polyangiaceae bacterium]